MKTNRLDLKIKRPLTPRFQMIFERIKKIANKQFNLELVYSPFSNKETHEDINNNNIYQSLLKNNSPLYLLDKIIFPVYMNDLIIGSVEAYGGQTLSKKQTFIIKNLIDLLSINDFNSPQLEALTQTEEQMAKSENNENTNLVFLNKKRTITAKPSNNNSMQTPPITFSINHSCLITSNSYNDIRMMAQEVHSRSTKYAFIGHDDLELDLLSLDEINEMGPITLVVSEVSQLSNKELKVIKEVLNQENDGSLPRVLLGTIYPLQTLLESQVLSNKDLLSLSLLEMTKTFFEIKKEGLSQFFFSRLKAH